MKTLLPVTLIGLILLIAGCSGNPQEHKKELRYVKVAKVTNPSSLGEKSFNATIEENHQSSVAFRVGGQVEKIFYSEGDYVKEGQVLARLDQRDFKTSLLAADAQYKQAKSEFERYSQLFEQGKFPRNSLDKLEAGYLAAKSNWESANNGLVDTELKAPFSGYIYQKLIENHEPVAPGEPALIIIDTNTLEVNFSVPETIVNQLSEGQEAKVSINQQINKRYPATIKSVAHKAGDDRLFNVRLKMQNPDPRTIKPGMTAKAIISNANPEQATSISVPAEALFYSGDQANVWVYNQQDSKVSKRAVGTGEIIENGWVQILQGIHENEMIVVAGVHSLMEGQQVKLLSQNSSL
ncbi:efflux RND transporter periplasmic adaptor subunit [Marinilabilia sp.]|uniref:efflux RND transporter periplasmic adaptor subunit n=1 Tax=Marinilabilia sp. TaxID=2021252 RepID=UPI0025C51E16|nr:efflux RND transporter periplasmic adaptor subunit [Marinilabilia sp.]